MLVAGGWRSAAGQPQATYFQLPTISVTPDLGSLCPDDLSCFPLEKFSKLRLSCFQKISVKKRWPPYLSQGERNFQKIADAFHAKSQEELQEMRQKGRVGTERRKMGERAFGPSKRELAQEELKHRAVQFRLEHPIHAPLEIAGTLGVNAVQMGDTPISTQMQIDRMKKLSGAVAKLHIEEEKEKEKKKKEAKAAYARTTGVEMVERAVRAIPGLKEIKKDLVSLPLHVGGNMKTALLQYRPDTGVMARDCCAALNAIPVNKHDPTVMNAVTAIDRYCEARYRPVYQEDWGNHGRGCGDFGPVNSPCFEKGVCLETTAGRRLYRFRNAVFAFMKSTCPPKTTMRNYLTDGWLVLALHGRPTFCVFPEEEGLEDQLEYWHVSFLLLSPYIPVFQKMSSEQTRAGDYAIEEGDIELVGDLSCLVEYDAFQTLENTEMRWNLRWLKLAARDLPLRRSEFVPRKRIVLPLQDHEDWTQIWPPLKNPKEPGPKKPPGPKKNKSKATGTGTQQKNQRKSTVGSKRASSSSSSSSAAPAAAPQHEEAEPGPSEGDEEMASDHDGEVDEKDLSAPLGPEDVDEGLSDEAGVKGDAEAAGVDHLDEVLIPDLLAADINAALGAQGAAPADGDPDSNVAMDDFDEGPEFGMEQTAADPGAAEQGGAESIWDMDELFGDDSDAEEATRGKAQPKRSAAASSSSSTASSSNAAASSSSSSATAPAAPPPYDPSIEVPPPNRLVTMYVKNGRIIFNPQTMQLIGKCDVPGHGKCAVHRSST